MFTHLVIFKIKKKDVPVYRKDCLMWGKDAAKYPGFIGYETLRRTNEKDQYASMYFWKKRADHLRFMKKRHDALVHLSKCPVGVVGYFDFASYPKLK